MKKRLLSAAIGLVAVAAVIFLNNINTIVIDIAAAVMASLSVYEIFTTLKISKSYIFYIPCMAFAVLLQFFSGKYIAVLFFLFSIAIFLEMLLRREHIKFKDIAVMYTGTVLVSFSLKSLALVNSAAGKNGSFLVLFILGIPWFSDAGAYFIGKRFGKHKMSPNISPKKTVEGAVGGIICSVICSLLLCFIFKATGNVHDDLNINYLFVAVVSVIGSLLGIFGDLVFSFMKREYKIKDFGNFLPGHGGVLDRFDSVIFVAPFIYVLSGFCPILG